MLNKLRIVEEEADESIYWIELLSDSGLVDPNLVKDRIAGFDEVVAIVVASQRTLKRNQQPVAAKPSHPKPK